MYKNGLVIRNGVRPMYESNAMAAVLCYKCSRVGHSAPDCTFIPRFNEADRMQYSVSSVVCFRCCQPGHIATSCTQICDDRCYRCREPGHLSKNCPLNTRHCYNCNEAGHLARDCRKRFEENRRNVKCYKCFRKGHTRKNCPKIEPHKKDKDDTAAK